MRCRTGVRMKKNFPIQDERASRSTESRHGRGANNKRLHVSDAGSVSNAEPIAVRSPEVDQISKPTDRGEEMPTAARCGQLDALYDAVEFAALLKLPRRTFDAKVARREIIPFEIGGRSFRYNLRINIAKWAHDSRVPVVVIAAAFGFDAAQMKGTK